MALPYDPSWGTKDGREVHLSLFMTQLLKFLQAGGGAAIGYNTVEKAVEINFVLGEKFQNVTVSLTAIVKNYQNPYQAIFICLCKLNGEIPETKKETDPERTGYYKKLPFDPLGHIPGSWQMSEEEIEARTKYR